LDKIDGGVPEVDVPLELLLSKQSKEHFTVLRVQETLEVAQFAELHRQLKATLKTLVFVAGYNRKAGETFLVVQNDPGVKGIDRRYFTGTQRKGAKLLE
jgi:hypothetical protein